MAVYPAHANRNCFSAGVNAHLVRELVKELQPLQILLIQRIIDIPGQVNLHGGRRHAEFGRIFSGDVVNVGEAEIERSGEVRAVPGKMSARSGPSTRRKRRAGR